MFYPLENLRASKVVEKCRQSKGFLIFIVYIALFLDNMLLTTVVPIIPDYLYKLNHPYASAQTTRNASSTSAREENRHYTQGELVESNSTELLYSEQLEHLTQLPVDKHVSEESIAVGVMFGSKASVQLITNLFVGPLTSRIGYTIPMFTGFVVMFISTIMFAFGESYAMLFLARASQGVGSACTSTAGMGMIASAYTEDKQRGAALGIVLGGLALGVLAGPPYGGLLYQWANKALPFLLLSLLVLFDGALQFIVLKPQITKGSGEEESTSIKQLLGDPYVIIAVGAIAFGNLGIAFLEPSLPLWMMNKMQATPAITGAAFLPASMAYLIGANIFGSLAHAMGRWLSSLIGLVLVAGSLLAIPSAESVCELLVPNGLIGLGIGMIDASMFPQMAYLVDIRHDGVYGNIYAISDAAFCLAFSLGPIFGSPIVAKIGFPSTIYIIAAITLLFAPLMIFLRDPPGVKKERLLSQDTVPYQTIAKNESP